MQTHEHSEPLLIGVPAIRTYAGDITARKHGGNAQSVEAHKKVDKQTDCKKILMVIRALGPMTAKQVARALDRQLNTISGRFTAMAGRDIERTGEVFEGAAVWRLK